jgi:hypothetical protein
MGSASVTPLGYFEVDPIRVLVRTAVVNDLKLVPNLAAMVETPGWQHTRCKSSGTSLGEFRAALSPWLLGPWSEHIFELSASQRGACCGWPYYCCSLQLTGVNAAKHEWRIAFRVLMLQWLSSVGQRIGSELPDQSCSQPVGAQLSRSHRCDASQCSSAYPQSSGL